MLVGAGFVLGAQTPASEEFLAALNAERSRMGLEVLAPSEALRRLAQARADEITAGEVLDFEPAAGSDVWKRARDLGYDGPLVQELTAVSEATPCEIVTGWNEALGASDAYRRPEARNVGVGFGVVGDSTLTVLVVGVPASHDSWRKRWPGSVPREWLTADLLDDVDRKRAGLGLPSVERSEDLGEAAQRVADELLADPGRGGQGRLRLPEGTLLFYEGAEIHVHDWRRALELWLATYRGALEVRGSPPVGAGLASRGRGGHLEAVWTVLIGSAGP